MSREGEPVSERVVRKVATATDSDSLELPPLYGSIDPDALDRLVAQLSDGEITFTYADHEVVVSGDGTVDLHHTPTERSTVGLPGDD
ncbi:HalOD1 output domain-containing protein [Halorubrum sp. DTA98]|uniref:HalOD1 output domain-containing protein n=1 Tax=Halorubrum sp. DTA98 TaxID=3402163 RepID=UPI003AAF375C